MLKQTRLKINEISADGACILDDGTKPFVLNKQCHASHQKRSNFLKMRSFV
ncbi:hypothetical protein [Candidatus Enterovibrio altilux]|uniref:hypothetical protein n=1 Tax=Candidatus Enterovibrio altilux TaxID=1927128 RepID=UPI0016804555